MLHELLMFSSFELHPLMIDFRLYTIVTAPQSSITQLAWTWLISKYPTKLT